MRSIKNFLVTFLDTLFIHTIRGSLLIGGAVLLLSHTGAWQYFSSSMLAHDMKRAAHWAPNASMSPKVVVVAVDDAGYQGFFSAKSPVDRHQVRQLLEAVALHAPNAKQIVVDLDLSPVPGQVTGQQALDDLLLQSPARWVLVAANSGAAADMAAQTQWRAKLCERGVRFGMPSVPMEFGYPRLTHQYQNGLAATALLPAASCAEPITTLSQTVMPLSAPMLQGGLVIPFSGDTNVLRGVLDAIDPEWVVVGGAWGSTDIFATPFGDRFGVQVHAAALVGAAEHQRVAPYIVQLLIAWLFVGFITVVLGVFSTISNRWFKPPNEAMVGHTFFVTSVQPLVFTLLVLGLLLALAEALSVVHARTGFWIPSGVVGCTTLAAVFFVWNWGKAAARAHDGFKAAWAKVVSQPIKKDIQSILIALKTLRRGSQPCAWGLGHDNVLISRQRAAFEGIFALVSLTMQTIAPLASVAYAVLKPL